MMAMRRWPSSIRWRVAVRPPCQLVVPTERMPAPGSTGGSITTSGIRAAASRCSSRLPGRCRTHSAPSVPRAVARSSQPANPAGRVHRGDDDAGAGLVGRLHGAAQQFLGPRAVQVGDQQVHHAEAEPGGDLVAVLPEQGGDPGPGAGGHVGAPVEHLGHGGDRDARLGGDARPGCCGRRHAPRRPSLFERIRHCIVTA